MSFWNAITGVASVDKTLDIADKTLTGVGNGLDKLFYTDEEKADAKLSEGIEYLNADQDKDMKENMRPDGGNARLVCQGRMNPKDGSDCSTPKTRKVNSFFPNKKYWNNFDGIKFYDSKDKSWRAK